ncbi:phosphoglycolate phosphatase [Pantoea sp. 1.19]|uniref:phosphoglycolate phosphatase n=1 Tax=Pantoea sp. 1.19 TaxID=1925589 RepID=UPI000948AC78|nr:phosphoglycolate phosphatase [Pantoea sp. 1.19]
MAPFTELRALAFDLDGTLVDSAPGLAAAVDLALAEQQLPPAGIARVATWIGNGADVMIVRALSWALGRAPTAAQANTARASFDRHYAQTAAGGSRLFPGVKTTLTTLAGAGWPLALVTNKPTRFVAPLLHDLGLTSLFTLAIGGDDVPVKKPHPAPLFLVLGRLGLLPRELLFVGDSRNDIQAAQAAGCPCVGLTYGYNYDEPIADSSPDVIFDHFNQLLPVVGQSLSGQKNEQTHRI